jgi:hypothetical protein
MAGEHFGALARSMSELMTVAAGQAVRSQIGEMARLVDAYPVGFKRAYELGTKMSLAINGEMRKAGEEIAADTTAIRDSGAVEEEAVEAEMNTLIASTRTLVLVWAALWWAPSWR